MKPSLPARWLDLLTPEERTSLDEVEELRTIADRLAERSRGTKPSARVGRPPTARAFAREVSGRLGLVPNFFRTAAAAPGLVEKLWEFARSAYLDSPLPSVFKERLFVHLSRFCEVRYCVARHVGFLVGLGHSAGDRRAVPETVQQAVALLSRPLPDATELDAGMARLESLPPMAELPASGGEAEADLFAALTQLFLEPGRSARARAAVRRAVGGACFELLTAFLAFVRTAHYWTETHPELELEPDVRAILEAHVELARLVRDPADAHRAQAGAQLRERAAWLRGQREALEAALNGAPLAESLEPLVRTAAECLGGGTRAAFYLANDAATALHHVVGMSAEYARAVDGFKIGPDSLACGLATATGQPVLTTDVMTEPRWERWRAVARRFKFRGCWSFPIHTSAGKFIGTLAIYSRHPRAATERDLELATLLTHTASIIIARHREAEARRRAEEALRDSNERIGKLVALMPAAVYTCDADGRLTFYNRHAAELWGREPPLGDDHEKFCGSFRMFTPDGTPLMHGKCPMADAVREGRSARDMEVVIERPTGARVVASVNIDPLYDREGRLVGAINVFVDVTERKRAEAALRESEERFRTLVRNIGDYAICMLDPLYDRDGRLVGAINVFVDVTERKRAEAALRESEERFRTLVRNIGDYAICMLDPSGVVTGWWDGDEQVLGYTAAEAIGKHISVFHTPEEVAAGEAERELAEAAATGKAVSEGWRVRKGGGRFWADVVTTAIRDAAGRVVGFTKISRDLTQRRQIEQERERLLAREQAARREAERVAVIKDEFLAVVSHELRTPLAAVLVYAKMLASGALRGPARDEAVDAIVQGAEAQRQMVEDLLDTSRMLSGKLHLAVREVELVPVVESALEAVRPTARAKGVKLETSLDRRTGRVLADPDRLRQVVWNVVNNAVKFTPGGGRVSVRLDRPDGRVRVVVRDTGRGIDPQFLPHVFDRFRQEDASCTREAGGLGLGMAIARQLVELHGGTIRAQSDGEGKGSTFTVELPLPDPRGGGASPARPRPQRRRSGAGRPASRPVPPALGGLRVLLVDDQPDNRSAFRLVLEAYGAAVDEAETADRALAVFGAALAAGEPFDLLVCDVGLPGRDGYDLIRAVRAVEREHGGAVGAPALALTAYARPEDRQRASDAGFQAHLAKPAEPADLVATLVALAGSRPGVPGDRR